ncbi:hypothetical protein FA13DRAFT_1804466 [Coprinellus micaceus]|uniref:Uncharacterized protein n=1 Tax=Coprinellus micaceus TaxID=71717 RepID=A0A4Y7S8J9_COPMI|nr:hypothetical protein FA13DRAFT_1804466 [Coprinellus micaceus]
MSQPSPPSAMIIVAADARADLNATTCLNPTANVVMGHLQDSPARLIEKRQLPYHSQAGISVRHMLVAQAALRHSHESPRHVPVAGVHQHGSRTFLVEAPYHYTELEVYLTATPTADRMSLVRPEISLFLPSGADDRLTSYLLVRVHSFNRR